MSDRRCLRALVSGLVVFSMLVSAASAKQPTEQFTVFGQCPRFTPTVNYCLYMKTTSGEMTIGGMGLGLKSSMTLQGGYYRDERGELPVENFFAAQNGATLSKTPQPVPGGLLGLLTPSALPKSLKDMLQTMLAKGATAVAATTELAGGASSIGLSTDNLINEEGTGLRLPVKVHLQNQFLGGDCYIGSSRNPIVLELTTATTHPPSPNRPIHGSLGHLDTLIAPDGLRYGEITENVTVDNSFSVPTVNGCGGASSSLVDAVVDAKLGLPSMPGHNTFVLRVNAEFATAENVIASEA